MSLIRLSMIDKEYLSFLRSGGDPESTDATAIAYKFVVEALKNPVIDEAAKANGFDRVDLVLLYQCMILGLMPNPCIKAGSLMLAASLPFYEPVRLVTMLEGIGADAAGLDPGERRKLIAARAAFNANLIWKAHTDSRGEADFKWTLGQATPKSGCFTIICVGITGLYAGWHLL